MSQVSLRVLKTVAAVLCLRFMLEQKGANCLVDNNGSVKLADFGAATQLHDMTTLDNGPRSLHGTPYWMSPEMIKQTGHGRQADIW